MAGKPLPAQKRQIEILSRVQWGICLFLILLGTFLCLEKYLAPGIPVRALAVLAGICSFMAEMMSAGRPAAPPSVSQGMSAGRPVPPSSDSQGPHHGKTKKLAISLLFFLFWGIAASRNQALLLGGGKEIANRVISLVNQHYRTEYLFWFVEPNGKGKAWVFLFLCSFAGFLESLFVSLTMDSSCEDHQFLKKKRSRNAAFLSMPLLVFTAGMLVGRTPSAEGLLLVLAGFLSLQLELDMRGTQILGAGMGLILLLAALIARSGMAQDILEAYHKPWLERQLNLENQMLEAVDRISGIRLFSKNKAQKEFPLNNDAPGQEGKEVFQITMDKRPEKAVYVRGFIGGDYEGGSWKSVSRQEFSDWAQKQGWSNAKCQEAVQNFPYRKLKKLEEKNGGKTSRQVKMELKTSVPGYTLVPYYTEIPENQPMEGDGSLAPGSGGRLQWDSFLFLEGWQKNDLVSLGEWEQKTGFQELSEEEKIWESYGSYVQQVYTRLPGQGLEKLELLAKEYDNIEVPQSGSSEIWRKSRQTMELLWWNAAYSQELDPLPEGEDYAEYFLLQQKKGFCVHFATAGTLVLRMYGVPSRYVSGYVVFPEDFKRNSDGTFTAVVTDERGHAWTEVFLEGTGFCPLELTPPFYFDVLAELEPGENIDDALREWGAGEPEEDETAQEQKQEQEDASQKEEQERTERNDKEKQPQVTAGQAGKENLEENMKAGAITIQALAKGIGLCLVLAFCFSFVLCWRRKRRKNKRLTEFFQANHAKGSLAMGRSMRLMLKSLGLGMEKDISLPEYGTFLEQELPGMGWERTMSLLQKAAFSEHGLTEEEFQAVAGTYRKLEQKAAAEKGWVWKWFFDLR